MMICAILFWLSVGCLVHSYILFPLLLKLISANKKLNEPAQTIFPNVSVIMAAYNEEKVIENKIRSVFKTNCSGKLELLIGSDGSTDATDSIIQKLIDEGFNIRFTRFGGRNGKSKIINALAPSATGEIFILTDANIVFDEQTIPELVKYFADPDVGLVGANIINTCKKNITL